MRRDIHFYVEHFTNENVLKNSPKCISEIRDEIIDDILECDLGSKIKLKRWVSVDNWEYVYDVGGNDDDDDDDDDGGFWEIPSGGAYYEESNYKISSELIDVVVEPRGIPYNISSAYKYICELWGEHSYNHSYFTLTELLLIDLKLM